MKDEKFYINGLICAETLGEICRALGEYFVVSAEEGCSLCKSGCSICFTRKE